MIAAGGNPKAVVLVFAYTMRINTHWYLLYLSEVLQVNYRQCRVVVRCAIAARVGDIEVIANNLEFFRLVTHCYLASYAECCSVHLEDGTQLGIGVNAHGTDIRTDIGLIPMETDAERRSHPDAAS